MDAALFLQQFGHLAQGEGSVKKLRDVILQLAVQGKLVAQNQADENAGVILLKSKPERKSQNNQTYQATHDSEPYPLPAKWVWTRLGHIAAYGVSQKVNSNDEITHDTWVLDLEDIEKDTSRLLQRVNAQERTFQSAKTVFQKGDVLFGKLRPYLNKVLVADDDGVCTTEIVPIRAQTAVNPNYIRLVLQSPMTMRAIEKLMYGMKMPRLGTSDANNLSFPLPPLAEQKRIVAKVDELMALCDKLEAEQNAQRVLKTQTVQSTLHQLTSAQTPSAFGSSFHILNRTFGNWFDNLTTVKHLRATILQLAVQGKLVHQDPSDEPAENFLNRINKNKCEFSPTEMPFRLPHGWTWASFPQLGEFGRGKSKHRPRNDPRLYRGGVHPFVQTGDVSRARDYIRTYSATYNDEGLAQSKMWPEGTMCITIAANIAETAILGFDACFPDSVVGFIPHKEITDARYFEYFLRTAKTRLEDFAPATAQKNINLGILEQVAIPLPPHAELKRIVAKVDELMTICDQLEAHITNTQTLNTHLMDSLIHRMTQAA